MCMEEGEVGGGEVGRLGQEALPVNMKAGVVDSGGIKRSAQIELRGR